MNIVYDSKDKEHQLDSKLMYTAQIPRWFLDGRMIVPDDHYGWIFPDPNDYKVKPVRDSVLRDNIDTVVFGKIVPAGGDDESGD